MISFVETYRIITKGCTGEDHVANVNSYSREDAERYANRHGGLAERVITRVRGPEQPPKNYSVTIEVVAESESDVQRWFDDISYHDSDMKLTSIQRVKK